MTLKSLYTPESAAEGDVLTREAAKALTDRVLSFAKADETRVNVVSGWSGNTRFAGNEITTSGGTTNTIINVTSTIGKRRASASTNVLDTESIKRTVELAERLAKLSPEDPEAMPELGPQTYTPVNSWFDKTADLTPETRATAAQRVISVAEQEGKAVGNLFVAGFLRANVSANVFLVPQGLAFERKLVVEGEPMRFFPGKK